MILRCLSHSESQAGLELWSLWDLPVDTDARPKGSFLLTKLASFGSFQRVWTTNDLDMLDDHDKNDQLKRPKLYTVFFQSVFLRSVPEVTINFHG